MNCCIIKNMRILVKKIGDELILGGHMHSLGVAGLIYAASLVYGKNIGVPLFFIIYLGIHISYLFNRYGEIENDLAGNPKRSEHIKQSLKYSKPILLLLISVLLILIIAYANYLSMLFSLLIMLLGYLYTSIIKRKFGNITGLKNIFIAVMFWSCLYLFYIFHDLEWNGVLTFFSILIFIRVLTNTVFFDLKDIESDAKEKIMTIPVLLGKKKTYLLINMLNVFSIFFIVLSVYYWNIPKVSLLLIVLSIYGFFYVYYSKRTSMSQDYFASLYADGEYLLWPLLVIINRLMDK